MTAVTLLTSLDYASAQELGISGSPSDIVARWAVTAVDAGARALVCSPHEVARLRAIVPSGGPPHHPGNPAGGGPARTISAAHRHRRKRSPTDRISWSSDAPSPESQTQQKR